MKVVQMIILMMIMIGTSTFASSMIYNYKIDNTKEVDVGQFIEDFSVISLTDMEIEEINKKKAEEELEIHKENEEEVEKERIKLLVSRGTRRAVNRKNTNMKTYMDFKKITSKSSLQYKLQQLPEVYTDEEGFRKIGDKFIVAIGTYFNCGVGSNIIVELDSGRVFEAVVGDIKANRDTDNENLSHRTDGSVLEFLVDTKKLDSLSRKMGNVSYAKIANLEGNVTSIVATEEPNIIIK